MSIQAYVALTAIVGNNPALLVAQRGDLFIEDRQLLMGERGPLAPKRFGWIVNACGTHLIGDNAMPIMAKMYEDSFHPTTGECRTSTDEFYVWDGQTLYSVSHEVLFSMVGQWRAELAEAV